MLLSIIVPCYNEECVIEETYVRLSQTISEMDIDCEILFVNDGSADRTGEILSSIAASDQRVKVINFSRNFGHQAAVTAGINHCKGDVAVLIDADLQDPPHAIKEMLHLMREENANVVYAVRKKRKGESWFKQVTAKYFYRILNHLSDVKFPLNTGDFRLMDRKVIDTFNQLTEKNKYIRGLISWIGFKQIPYYYERDERFAGETKYPLKKMMKFAAVGLIYFSRKPLQIASVLGFLAVLVGILYACVVLFMKLFTPSYLVSGWSSIVILIIFFGGVQLLTIGVLGQYIGSLFDEVKDRPDYIIDTKVNIE